MFIDNKTRSLTFVRCRERDWLIFERRANLCVDDVSVKTVTFFKSSERSNLSATSGNVDQLRR